MHSIRNLAEHPMLCVVISAICFLLSGFLCYSMLNRLIKMHRSKTAVKKLMREYTFFQKVWMQPYENNCLHAVNFCKYLITFQRIGRIGLCIYALICLLNAMGVCSNMTLFWCSVVRLGLLDLPVFIIDLGLARPFIFGRFKKYSFEKYHNTDNHNSLL